MLKVNNKYTRTTPLKSFWGLIANFEHISHLFLVFLLLTLNTQLPAGDKKNVVKTYPIRNEALLISFRYDCYPIWKSRHKLGCSVSIKLYLCLLDISLYWIFFKKEMKETGLYSVVFWKLHPGYFVSRN